MERIKQGFLTRRNLILDIRMKMDRDHQNPKPQQSYLALKTSQGSHPPNKSIKQEFRHPDHAKRLSEPHTRTTTPQDPKAPDPSKQPVSLNIIRKIKRSPPTPPHSTSPPEAVTNQLGPSYPFSLPLANSAQRHTKCGILLLLLSINVSLAVSNDHDQQHAQQDEGHLHR